MATPEPNMVEFSAAVYELARFISPGNEDQILQQYLDSRNLPRFPPGTFVDYPRPTTSAQTQDEDEAMSGM